MFEMSGAASSTFLPRFVLWNWEKLNASRREIPGSTQSPVSKRQKRMLTLFTTAKPFRGGDLTRQRNALRSWTLVHPDCQVILFGDVPEAHEVAAELGIHHVPDVLRSEYGSVRLDDMFARAQEMARHD